MVNSLYGATYDGKARYSYLAPYLFSFSTHADDAAFEREHGVRSQWDCYAGAEGYCLVFDIRSMADLLKQEGNARYWAWLMLEPVRYADRPIDEIFPELVSGLADTLRQLLSGIKEPEAAAREFLIGTTLLKRSKYKPTDRRYVALFDGLGIRLPIKRVIIGPGSRHDERAVLARSLLGDVPITNSLA